VVIIIHVLPPVQSWLILHLAIKPGQYVALFNDLLPYLPLIQALNQAVYKHLQDLSQPGPSVEPWDPKAKLAASVISSHQN